MALTRYYSDTNVVNERAKITRIPWTCTKACTASESITNRQKKDQKSNFKDQRSKIPLQEFRVSAAYLSQWSLYFRAYFAAEMTEKKQGVFPVKVG